jgi:uncharacterized integral membrane protein
VSEDGNNTAPVSGDGKKGGLRPGHIVLIVALVVVIIAIIQNWEKARLSFLWWDLDVWVWLLVALSAVLGFAIGWFAHVQRARARRKNR